MPAALKWDHVAVGIHCITLAAAAGLLSIPTRAISKAGLVNALIDSQTTASIFWCKDNCLYHYAALHIPIGDDTCK